MNELLANQAYICPYCGEVIDTLVDISQGDHRTIEDCSVCCRPIELNIEIGVSDQKINLTAHSDSE